MNFKKFLKTFVKQKNFQFIQKKKIKKPNSISK